jgi:hypothetical protein
VAAALVAVVVQARAAEPGAMRGQPAVPDPASEPRAEVRDGRDLLAREITVRLGVRDAAAAAEAAQRELADAGGQLESRSGREIVVAVPFGRLEAALARLAAVGAELGRDVDAIDLADQVLETEARRRSARAALERLLAFRPAGPPDTGGAIHLEQERARLGQEIGALEARLHGLEQRAAAARVRVVLEVAGEPVAEALPRHKLPVPWLQLLGLPRLVDLNRREVALRPPGSRRIRSGADMGFMLDVALPREPERIGGTHGAVAGGFRLRGMLDADPVGPALGLDLMLGGGSSGGLGYEVRAVVGLGAGLGRHLMLGLFTGVGIDGLSGGHVPFAVGIPVELTVAGDVARWARVFAWGRSSFVFASQERNDGAAHAPFGDELAAGLSWLLGRESGRWNQSRSGVLVGGAYREMLGTQVFTATVGYAGAFKELRE